ncbi:MAG: flagellar biosynthesis anti-sigma factor FlgM [Plesiomonas sp.]|uniref:flagellar biosynthesis anti-sigma factor FlgM n=1 Tax=Plesiomonas sp. TaxID=2486279 RepID=UPI003F3D4FD6
MSSIDKVTYTHLNSAAAGKALSNTVNSHSDTAASDISPSTTASQIGSAIDGVTLTSQAQTLAQVPKQVNSEMPFDSEKVERLKQAINAGEYQVNPEKLAANLLKLESGSY